MPRLLLVIMIALMLAGCGYSLASREKSPLFGRSVAVDLFANRTYQPNLEGELRRALVAELGGKGGSMLPGATAELQMSGELASFTIDTSAYSRSDRAMVYRLAIAAEVQLAERRTGKILWKGRESVRDEYPATADLALQRNAREAAVTAICSRLAQQIVTRMEQAF